MLRAISVIALAKASCLISTIVTGKPARAQTWAIPLPICPAPMTPTESISGISAIMGATFVPGWPAADLTSTFISGALQFRCQLRQRGEQISHQAVIGDLEDGRFLILVDCHDDLAVLHAGEVLNGPRNPDSDIQFRRDNFPGLTDLELIGHEAGVHSRPRRTDSGTQFISNRFDKLE